MSSGWTRTPKGRAGEAHSAARGSRDTVMRSLGASTGKLAAAAFALKAGAGLSLAALALTSAAAASALPQPVQDRVAVALEAVSTADLPDSKDNNRGGVSEEKKHHGRDAHQKARNAPAATATARIPVSKGRPASPGQQGLDQANSGPAAGHARTAAPAPGGNKPSAKPSAKPSNQGQRPEQSPGSGSQGRGGEKRASQPTPPPTTAPTPTG